MSAAGTQVHGFSLQGSAFGLALTSLARLPLEDGESLAWYRPLDALDSQHLIERYPSPIATSMDLDVRERYRQDNAGNVTLAPFVEHFPGPEAWVLEEGEMRNCQSHL